MAMNRWKFSKMKSLSLMLSMLRFIDPKAVQVEFAMGFLVLPTYLKSSFCFWDGMKYDSFWKNPGSETNYLGPETAEDDH